MRKREIADLFERLVYPMGTPAKLIELPQSTKVLPCGKCGREMTVSIRTVLAYCPACSAGLGEKK